MTAVSVNDPDSFRLRLTPQPPPSERGRFLNNAAPAQNAPGPLASLWAYAFSPSGMMQVIRVRQLQEFQPDQGQPSEATGPGAM